VPSYSLAMAPRVPIRRTPGIKRDLRRKKNGDA
jgi:hypothetical protein